MPSVTRIICEPGTILLRASFGQADFVPGVLERKVEKVKRITNMLPCLEDPQTEYCLLRACLSLQKLMFCLRTVDTIGHR